jgi:catechol 2,3-dioxygenase-like lactoylglutathione lyase family enzyme
MHITHFTLATRDVPKTARFFAEALGWRPIERANPLPFRAAWLEMSPGFEVHLAEVVDFEPSPFEREFGRHIAVTYPRDGFTALKERLRGHGAEIMAAAGGGAVERFFFRDLNGYVIEVVAE